RSRTTAEVVEFEAAARRAISQRQFAQERGVPRTTLQDWLSRKATIDADPSVTAFFESPVGLAFSHRLGIAAHLIFTPVGPCGIRLICQFLELSKLDRFMPLLRERSNRSRNRCQRVWPASARKSDLVWPKAGRRRRSQFVKTKPIIRRFVWLRSNPFRTSSWSKGTPKVATPKPGSRRSRRPPEDWPWRGFKLAAMRPKGFSLTCVRGWGRIIHRICFTPSMSDTRRRAFRSGRRVHRPVKRGSKPSRRSELPKRSLKSIGGSRPEGAFRPTSRNRSPVPGRPSRRLAPDARPPKRDALKGKKLSAG